jgi:hypothetical protein
MDLELELKEMYEALSAEEKEHIKLCWELIEYKITYYYPNLVDDSRILDYTIEDDLYDQKELRYLELCRLLKYTNTIVHKSYPGYEDLNTERAMFEVDFSRPSVQLVLSKLSSPKGKENDQRAGGEVNL